jgi:hypothetical protein
MLRIASDAASVEEFVVRHVGHAEGTCMKCDAYRRLAGIAAGGLGLHKIRRSLGGHGGERDPLDPPLLLGVWRVAFSSAEASRRAHDEGWTDDLGGLIAKCRGDRTSLERRISFGYEDMDDVRAGVSAWVVAFNGTITAEEIRPLS